MANDNTLNVEISAVITDLEKNLKKATKGLEKFSDKAKAVGKKMQTTGIAMSKAFTVPLAILGGVALKAAADLETLETSLSVMTGSAEKGKAIMKDLAEFTAKTPFQLEGVGNTAKQLLAFGFTTQQVKTNLQFLGDAAAGSGNDLGSLGQIFGQVSAAGKLTAERLNQLNERAIPIGAAIAKTMGIAETSVREMVSKGKVDFATFEKAFKSLSTEGGIFEGAMIKQSKTLAGVFSTLKDNVQLALGELGQEIATTFDLKQVTADLIAGIQKVTKWFASLDDSTKKIIIQFAAFVAILGPLLTIIGLFATTVLPGLITVFTFLSATVLPAVVSGFNALTVAILANPIGALAAAIALIVGGFVSLIQRITPAVSKLKTFFNLIKSGGNQAAFVNLQMADQVAAMKEQADAADESAKATERLKNEQALAAQNAARLTALLTPTTPDATGGGGFKAIVSKMQTFRDEIKPIANDINQSIVNAVPSGEQITLKAVEMQASLMAFNNAAADIIGNSISNTFSQLGSSIGEALVTGGNVLQSIGSTILQGLGNFLSEMGGLLIKYGTLAVLKGKLDLAILAGGPVAIGAGLAAIAVGLALSVAGAALGSLASGGSSSGGDSGGGSRRSSGSTTSFSGSGGSSGGTFVFEIAGTKLIGVLKNTLDRNKALGGTNLSFG